MFLHLSVSHSVYGEVYNPKADTVLGRHLPGQTPPENATEVGGMHPTGIHSCLQIILVNED